MDPSFDTVSFAMNAAGVTAIPADAVNTAAVDPVYSVPVTAAESQPPQRPIDRSRFITGRFPIGSDHFVDIFQGEYVGIREFISYGSKKLYPTRNGTCMNRFQWIHLVNHVPDITLAMATLEPNSYTLGEAFRVDVATDKQLGAMVVFHRGDKQPYTLYSEQWDALMSWAPLVTDTLFPSATEAIENVLNAV